ncbi:MAG: hypothetical protein KGQ49_04425 [Verrucomicrobia bacterium]|nr:hypothetical protein [Verrucomicrobiota bacterium]MBU6446623.1 hypothetical protein [Verrucomicrobiota bacterium]MDE3047074.1 hypothetical protein [Verrucomicrobiota bacterium]
MRRILWMIFFFGAYLWVMTSGRDRMLLEQGKQLYQTIVAWLDDADVDFQTHSKPNKAKEKIKKRKRWDY